MDNSIPTPKWVVLTNSLGDHHTRNYHYFTEGLAADRAYNDSVSYGLMPTKRPWYEAHDRPIYNLLKS